MLNGIRVSKKVVLAVTNAFNMSVVAEPGEKDAVLAPHNESTLIKLISPSELVRIRP